MEYAWCKKQESGAANTADRRKEKGGGGGDEARSQHNQQTIEQSVTDDELNTVKSLNILLFTSTDDKRP